jgi:hypothetical protein
MRQTPSRKGELVAGIVRPLDSAFLIRRILRLGGARCKVQGAVGPLSWLSF